jgi:hypothetical protein
MILVLATGALRWLSRSWGLIRAQPVSQASLGDQVSRSARIGFDLVAQVFDAHAQSPRVVKAIRAPYLAHELSLPHDHSSLARQTLEHSIFEWSEMNVPLRPAGASTGQVNLEFSEVQKRMLLYTPRVSAQSCPHSCE